MKEELFLITSLTVAVSHEMELHHTISSATNPKSEQVFSYSQILSSKIVLQFSFV